MDSNRIKKLAEGARTSLMTEVSAALERVLAPESEEAISDSGGVANVKKLVESDGKSAVVERVAYTWFNRLCALRYMDVKGYTPVPCVSMRASESMPAILSDARRSKFDESLVPKGNMRNRISSLLLGAVASENPLGQAYVLLLLSVCDVYRQSMGYLFGSSDQNFSDAMRLLAPADLLSKDSVLAKIEAGMDEDTCSEVEVMGWLYQYYIAERKDEVFASFKKKKKASAEEIKPATQLFTPNWIVRYMVENSLGRLWILNFPESKLIDQMDYYIKPESVETDFIKINSPEDISFCDPACGSGHILVYAFDLLYAMYLEEGYRGVDIPSLILTKNLHGFEIDDRAAEIAAFVLEMKAREKDSSFFEKGIDARITVFHKCEFTKEEHIYVPELSAKTELLDTISHLDEVGSLWHPTADEIATIEDALAVAPDETKEVFTQNLATKLRKLSQIAKTLSNRYDVVVANPPYMGSGNLNGWMSTWLKENYPDGKNDLFAAFIFRNLTLAKEHGELGFMTPYVWMFIGSYEKMRGFLIENKTITSLIQLEYSGFSGATVPICTFTIQNSHVKNYKGGYIRLSDFVGSAKQAPKTLEAIHNPDCGWFYRCDADSFRAIPGSPIAYWISKNAISVYEQAIPLRNIGHPCKGIDTGDNNQFVRCWWEVSFGNVRIPGIAKGRWVPYNKGLGYRKWFGNNLMLVDWANEGSDLASFHGSNLRNRNYYFKPGVTWGTVTSSNLSFRLFPEGFLFDNGGSCIFAAHEELVHIVAFLNSSVSDYFLKLSPTLNSQPGEIGKLPIIKSPLLEDVPRIVATNTALSKSDWDAYEVSWDFDHSAFVCPEYSISDAFDIWERKRQVDFSALKRNEESLNQLFIDVYGMVGETSAEVPNDKVTISLADRGRDVRSLISYAVGCLFGRYSLDEDGLILANQGDTVESYLTRIPSPTFMPDKNNIIPVLDEEWFEDDVVGQFKLWLKKAYGEESYNENLDFIEGALGMDIRTYFSKKSGGFYDDHCQTYSVTGSGKRPIYWMFSSPNNSFNALIYMHRYNEGTVSTLLTEYVRELRRKLEAQRSSMLASSSARDQSQAAKYQAMIEEIDAWEREVLYPLAQQHVSIDLDDGVKVNYNKFPHALRKVGSLSKW